MADSYEWFLSHIEAIKRLLCRSEACPGAVDGAHSQISQQWRLLPSHNAQALLHVERRVRQRHREGQGSDTFTEEGSFKKALEPVVGVARLTLSPVVSCGTCSRFDQASEMATYIQTKRDLGCKAPQVTVLEEGINTDSRWAKEFWSLLGGKTQYRGS